jgi:hypothetical protein
MKHGDAPGIRLFRSPAHLNHWIVWSDRTGWLIFPATFNGWQERQLYPGVNPARLQSVPLWMGFNTGLLEAIIAKAA